MGHGRGAAAQLLLLLLLLTALLLLPLLQARTRDILGGAGLFALSHSHVHSSVRARRDW
jgi:hypothetical protein